MFPPPVLRRAKAKKGKSMGKQVIVVDDNPANRKLLYFALRTGNYEIHEAGSAAELTLLIEQVTPDLALLDIELPDTDGLTLAKTLREQFPKTIMIMLSVLDSPDILKKAFEVGANGYVVKPYNLREVLDLICHLESTPADLFSNMRLLYNNASLSLYVNPQQREGSLQMKEANS
jgi:DNA-binding response OmpR family regulator